jgi:hypothetical protein
LGNCQNFTAACRYRGIVPNLPLAFSHLMNSFIFDTQLINWFVDTLSITIGVNLWFAPQISEHCPYRSPGRFQLFHDSGRQQ